ncbi:MAG: hypothetical protein DBX47_07605 [Clostridiales bacterium]|nr:MAG: hypothetical protein DBX47_07605 [Clostridiales bacterium]
MQRTLQIKEAPGIKSRFGDLQPIKKQLVNIIFKWHCLLLKGYTKLVICPFRTLYSHKKSF